MRAVHRIDIPVIAALLLSTLLIPQSSVGETLQFGDYIVRYSAVSTNALGVEAAKTYGIERSSRNGLLNIAVQKKHESGEPELIGAKINGIVGDLTGHHHPIAFRETKEGGDIDYLGEFPIDGSGTYVFSINVFPADSTQHVAIKFNQDYVVD
jgi:Domain of unknown function (DUF4426)